jgi:hypothetical protein
MAIFEPGLMSSVRFEIVGGNEVLNRMLVQDLQDDYQYSRVSQCDLVEANLAP